jgi:hypothetical protein
MEHFNALTTPGCWTSCRWKRAIPATLTAEPGVFVLPHFEFKLEQEAVLELAIWAEGFERTVAISKTISISPGDPNVWPPPSSQSRHVALETSSQPEPSPQAAPKKRRRSKAQ